MKKSLRTNYYPFGGVLTHWESNNNDRYRFGYQGEFAEKDEETGFNHFELRDFDSKIGRWMATDPYGQFSSPYNGMGNNPVNGVDPDGGFLFGLFGSTSQQRQDARQLASIKGGEVLNWASKDIAVTWSERTGADSFEWQVTSDFSLQNNLSFTEGLLNNASQGDSDALGILRNAGFGDAAFSLDLAARREKSGDAFFAFGTAVLTAPLSMGLGSFGLNAGRTGLGNAMWQSRFLGPRSLAFGRYHDKFIPFGTRGLFNGAKGGRGIGIGWSNHGARHVFRGKIGRTKIFNIYK